MELAASRRIREHFNATHHFRAACSSAYNELLGQRASAGVEPYALYTAVVRVHEILGDSLDRYRRRAPIAPSWDRAERAFRARRGHRRLASDGDGVERALRSVRVCDLTEEIVLNEAEFEELALDVIAGEVLSYLKLDFVLRILSMAMVTGIVAAGNPDRYGYLALVFAESCVSMVALYFLGVMFRDLFFLL